MTDPIKKSVQTLPKAALDHTQLTRTRAENARTLYQNFAESQLAAGAPTNGLEQAFAKLIQVSPSMWSQIKSSRPIGNKIARQIESLCKMPGGWLDEKREAGADAISAGEQQYLSFALKAYRVTNSVGRKNLKHLVRSIAEGKVSPERLKAIGDQI